MALPPDAIPVGQLPADAVPVDSAAGALGTIVQDTLKGYTPEQRLALKYPKDGVADRAMLGRFTAEVQDKFDTQQEEMFLRYAAEHTNVPPATMAKARQLLIAKPEYGIDAIVKNLASVEREVQLEGFPWAQAAKQHPVLAKYLQDPETAGQALQDSAKLTGLDRALGGIVEEVGAPTVDPKTGQIYTPKTLQWTPPGWAKAAYDAFAKDMPALGLRSAVMITKAQMYVGSFFGPVSGERIRSLEAAARKANEVTTATSDYFGPAVGESWTDPERLTRSFEHGVGFVARNLPILLGAGAGVKAGGKAGLWAVNTIFAAPDVYETAEKTTESTGKALALTAVGAPVVGRIMGFNPISAAAGSPYFSLLTQHVAEAASKAASTHAFARVGFGLAAKFGLDYYAGKTAFAAQSAAMATVGEIGNAMSGKPYDQRAVYQAAMRGWDDGSAAALLTLGTMGAHLISEYGRSVRAAGMSRQVNRGLDLAAQPSSDPAMTEKALKEIAAQPGRDTHLHLRIDKVEEVLGDRVRPVLGEVFGDEGQAYDKARREGAEHIAVPVEKLGVLMQHGELEKLAREDGTFDPEVMTAVQVKERAKRFEDDLKAALKIDPETLPQDERAIFDAVKAFAGSDEAAAKEMFAYAKAIHAQKPELTLQQVFDAAWGPGGLWGPPAEAANEAVPGEHRRVKVEPARLIDTLGQEYGLYNSREWMSALKDEQAKADLVQREHEARQAARDRMEAALKHNVRQQIYDERKRLEAQAESEIKNDLGQRALHFFKTGEVWDLDKNDHRSIMLHDPEAPDRPLRLSEAQVRSLGFDPEQFPKQAITKGDKFIDVDVAANALGWEGTSGTSGPARQMLAALRDALPEREFRRQWADARLKSLHADLAENPQLLLRSALDSIHSEKAVPLLLSRLRALSSQLDPTRRARSAMSGDMWDGLSRRLLLEKTVGQIKPETFARASKAASERALKALGEGKFDRAFDATEAAVLNHYLYRNARDLEGSLNAKYAHVAERVTSKSYRAALGRNEHPEYRRLSDALTDALGLSKTGTYDPTADFVGEFADRAKANGHADALAMDQDGGWDSATIRALTSGARAWKDLTPAEANGVFKALKNIEHLAKLQNDKIASLAIESRSQAIAEMANHLPLIRGKIGREPGELNLLQRALETTKNFLMLDEANTTATRLILKYLGPSIYDKVWPEFVKRKVQAHDLFVDLVSKWQETQRVWEHEPNLDKPVEVEGLRMPKGEEFTKGHLIQAAKWFGSESGRKKLLDGFNASPGAFLRAFGEHLSRENFIAIQAEHDFHDTHLRPLKAEAWERRKGLPWEPVEPLGYTVSFADGTSIDMKGGYYPVHWDNRAGVSRSFEPVELTSPTGQRDPQVFNSSNLARTKFVGVPDLNWTNMPGHIKADVHDLAFGDFVLDTGRLLLHPDALRAIRDNLGQNFANWPRAWLERVRDDGYSYAAPDVAKTLRAQLAMRRGVVTSMLGGKIALALGDLVHPLTVAMAREGATVSYAMPSLSRVLQGTIAKLTLGTDPLHDEIISKSDVVRVRLDTLHERLSDWYTGTYVHGDNVPDQMKAWRRFVDRAAFYHLAKSDAITTKAIWDMEYRAALDDGRGEAAARKAGDDAVLASMPDYDPKTIPAIMAKRHDTLGSAFVVFFSYRAKLLEMAQESKYDKLIDPGRPQPHAPGATWRDKLMANFEGYASHAGTMAALVGLGIVGGDLIQGHGKKEREDWETWAARRLSAAPMMLYPYLGEMATSVSEAAWASGPRQKAYKFVFNNPYFAPLERVVNGIDKALVGRTGEDQLYALIDAALVFGRLPADAPLRAVKYNIDVLQGDQSPRGGWDFVGGNLYGRKSGRLSPYNETNPLIMLQDVATEGAK